MLGRVKGFRDKRQADKYGLSVEELKEKKKEIKKIETDAFFEERMIVAKKRGKELAQPKPKGTSFSSKMQNFSKAMNSAAGYDPAVSSQRSRKKKKKQESDPADMFNPLLR